MNVTLLVPEIHDRPTGGNIYNRRMITELQRRETAEAVPWVPDDTLVPAPLVPSDAPAAHGVLLVDSLLLRHDNALRRLHQALPDASVVLLAHYLHCIDPNEQSTDTAERERTLLPLFDGAITTSPFARQALVDEGLPEDRVHAVPPGLDDAYRAPVAERDDTPPTTLLTVSNLLPGKGLLDFVDVLGTLPDTPWRWTLVGDDTLDPDFADSLHTRIRDRGIADRATITGPIPSSDLRAHYDNSDIFVLPSRFETCSMATREAMARGLPVVGYAVGGMPDNFGDDQAGRLISPDSHDALTDALQALLADPELRTRMGRAARERSQSFPSWADAGTRFHSALQTLSASRKNETGECHR